MAVRISAGSLQDEASCSICLEIFQDPVAIHCGHSFCRLCITQSWEGLTTNFSCPRCRETVPQKSLRPNWELANLIEAAQRLNLQPVSEVEGRENLCKKHKEALKLFCKDEERLICVVCDRSKMHRNHFVVPVDEAVQEYKERIQTQLQLLKSEQEELQSCVEDREGRIQDYAKRMEAEKQKIVTKHTQMCKLLKDQESFLLDQLDQLVMEITDTHKETLAKLLERIASLGALIGEMERKCQQPSGELLKDIKATLSRCERGKLSPPPDIFPEVEKKFRHFKKKTSKVKNSMKEFQGILEFTTSLPKMTWDLKTANAVLHLAEDLSLTCRGSHKQDLPSNPERFKVHPCVLGSRGFTWGWHCWEVEIRGRGTWAIGVAKGSVPREKHFPLKPESGVWALWHSGDGCKALTSPDATPLTLRSVPQRIRVCLDCQEGTVVFYDAVSKAQIFAFLGVSFKGERVYPWFLVMEDVCLKLISKDTGQKK